jgi:NAD(P)H-dependent flavin oxidoreductase YrpB (nitropropane dioxygenase family)
MFEGNRVVAHTRSRYPIFQSPMTWIARSQLVSAVSAAGGMGLLESSARELAMTTREFGAIRAATNQPFGVNLPVRYLQADPKEERAIIDWLLAQGIHFMTTSAGDPGRYVKILKDAGVTGTILTDNPPRARSRGLRTPYSMAVSEGTLERLPPMATLDMLYVSGDVANTSGSAGESAGLIHEIESVRQIIDDTIAGFWREIDRLAALRPQAADQQQRRAG